jgi:hypothetical protein
VFICDRCHVALLELERGDANAYAAANAAIIEKTRLLVASPSLRWVMEHRELVAQGFVEGNRAAPSLTVGASGVEHTGLFGAVGESGRRYYFVGAQPGQAKDGAVEVVDPVADGVEAAPRSEPATGAWVRFLGDDGGVLTAFINAHARQVLPTADLSALRQV